MNCMIWVWNRNLWGNVFAPPYMSDGHAVCAFILTQADRSALSGGAVRPWIKIFRYARGFSGIAAVYAEYMQISLVLDFYFLSFRRKMEAEAQKKTFILWERSALQICRALRSCRWWLLPAIRYILSLVSVAYFWTNHRCPYQIRVCCL